MPLQDNLLDFTDILNNESEVIENSQPMSLISMSPEIPIVATNRVRPEKYTGQYGEFRSIEEIDSKYRNVFKYPFFNLVQSRVIEDALYSDKSLVVCAPTGSGKTVVFEMAIVKLLMDLEDQGYSEDFKIIYMAPVKAICTERLTEWYSKFTELGILCIEVTGDTDVDFFQLKPYRIIITTPEKWDILTRRWTDHRSLVEVIKLFLIDEVHILNDECRGPVLEAVVSRMRTIEASCITSHRNELLKRKVENNESLTEIDELPPRIRFVAVSATVSNPEDVATWLGNADKPAVYHKFGDECRPVKINRVVEGYPCSAGTSIFKFDIILNYKLWAIIQKYYYGKPTLIFCNTRKGVVLTAETLSREITITFNPEQLAKLTALASTIKNKKIQALVLSGVGCHHAGMLFEERTSIEQAFRNRDLPILITTTTLAMGVNLPAHLVIIKNTQYYVNGAYQEYPISTVLQMIGRAGRPQFDTEATAVIMTRSQDKPRYQSLVGGSEPLQSFLHKRLAENLNSEAALHTVTDLAQCVDWLRSTFLFVRAGRDPRRYLNLPSNAAPQHILKKIEDLCVKAMNGLASSGLITMDDACCIESTEAGRLMSIFYIDFETMKHIMKIDGTESLERLLWILCESHELAEMHLRVDERRCLNTLNRSNTSATIRFPMKGKISTRQMKLNCIIQAILGGLPIPDPALNQEAMRIIRIADRVCKCMVSYITRPDLISRHSPFYSAILNGITLAKCIVAQLWENSTYVCRQLRGIGPAFSTSLVTAGKYNFLLLEESHPRDLERIMNKGPPAGNILRKQISLLPKYQLTLTPLDYKTVSIKVSLLNQAYLSENIENLTAGSNHKAYVIIGDTDNSLLLLTSFRDKDLINVYDGCITYLVDRKYEYEHTIKVNCISATFVGIDVTAEYTFKKPNNIENQINTNFKTINQTNTPKSNIERNKTEIINKEKKRKTNDVHVECAEKRKREYAIINEFNSLKKSLGSNYKELEDQLHKSEIISQNILKEMNNKIENNKRQNLVIIESPTKLIRNTDKKYDSLPVISFDHSVRDDDTTLDNMDIEEGFAEIDLPDFERIQNILNKVENEIMVLNEPTQIVQSKTSSLQKNISVNEINSISSSLTHVTKKKSLKQNNRSKQDNFKFLDSNENKNVEQTKEFSGEGGFSKTIKFNLDKFLENTKEQNCNKQQTIDTLLLNDIALERSQNQSTSQTNLLHGNNSVKYINDFSHNKNNVSQFSNYNHQSKRVSNDCVTTISDTVSCNDQNSGQLLMLQFCNKVDLKNKPSYNDCSQTNNIKEQNILQLTSKDNLKRYDTNTNSETIKENDNKLIKNINHLSSKQSSIIEVFSNDSNNYHPNEIVPLKNHLADNKFDLTHFEHTVSFINDMNRNKQKLENEIINLNENNNINMFSQQTMLKNGNKVGENNNNLSCHSNYPSEHLATGCDTSSTKLQPKTMTTGYSNFIDNGNHPNLNINSNDIVKCTSNNNNENMNKPISINNDILYDRTQNIYNKPFNNIFESNFNPTKYTKTIKDISGNKAKILVHGLSDNRIHNKNCVSSNMTLKTSISDTSSDNNLSETSYNSQIETTASNYNKYTNNKNEKFFSKHIKINNIETSVTSNISTYEVNYFENKKIRKCQLELIKKCTLDLDVTDILYGEKNNKRGDFNETTNNDNSQKLQKNKLNTLFPVNNNTYNYSNIHKIPQNMAICTTNTIESNVVTNQNEDKVQNKLVRLLDYTKLKNLKTPTVINQAQERCANKNVCDTSSMININLKYNKYNLANTMPKLKLDGTEASNPSELTIVQEQHADIKLNENRKDINAEFSKQATNQELESSSETNKSNNINITSNIKKYESVENILSKYLTVLRKNDVVETPDEIAHTKNTDKCFEKSNVKPKKLFQIRNINIIDVDIPDSLIPNIPSHSSAEEVENFIENKQNDYDQLKLNEIMETTDLHIGSDICETKLDVDQSLLDPKILLECYQGNNETVDIVPPPQEFADKLPCSYEQFNESSWNVMDVNNSSTDKLLNDSKDFDKPYNEHFVSENKLFQDVSGPSVASVNMSISHEVETWTLTPEDKANNPLYDNSMKTFTVMRTNPIASSANINRLDKFRSFKFKDKEKFKFKK